jgi:hypothetical protein
VALPVLLVAEVRQNGSDTNGGAFLPGASGTDYSQQATAQYVVTNGTTAGSVTVGLSIASSDMVGNVAYIAGGTGSVVGGWYYISGYVLNTSITVDRATGLTSGTGVTINIGGAWATWGNAATVMVVSTQKIWIKYSATPYTITTATAGPGGPMALANVLLTVEGYDVTRGDRTGNQPVLTWPTSGVTAGSLTYLVTAPSGTRSAFMNLSVNGNNVANVGGFNCSSWAGNVLLQCTALNCSGTLGVGFGLAAAGLASGCYAYNCLAGFSTGNCLNCFAYTCTTGFKNPALCTRCIAYSCATGFTSSLTPSVFSHCTADANTVSGFTTTGWGILTNCIASNTNSGGYGFVAASNVMCMYNCFYYQNIGGNVNGTPFINEGAVQLTVQPYTLAGYDWRPNTAVGGGASMRGAATGFLGSPLTNEDIGACQHADPAASSAYVVHPIQVGF